jgi:predicted CDP-diglyceride synthetase/phosphatidate cytidylyltransferase
MFNAGKNCSPSVSSMSTWGSIYRGVKKVIITMSVMLPFNYYILRLHSHGVIMVLRHLQIFLIPTNRGQMRVIHLEHFIQRRPPKTCAAFSVTYQCFWGLCPG